MDIKSLYKKVLVVFACTFISSAVLSGCGAKYSDGVYEGQSKATSEGYYGKTKVTVEDGKISAVEFAIFDWDKRLLDVSYGKEVFADNLHFQEQTNNEVEGIEQYKTELIKRQDITEVDTISGATWSGMIFKETVEEAMKQAAE